MNRVRTLGFVLTCLGMFSSSADALPVLVVDTLAGIDTSIQFQVIGGGGLAIGRTGVTDIQQFVAGPQFVLGGTTVITEVGAFLEPCVRGCLNPTTVARVGVYPDLNGKPDLANVIASMPLSNDGNAGLISYESVSLHLLLESGTYYALFGPIDPTG